MIACDAACIDDDRRVNICGAKAAFRISFGARNYPICRAHEMIWTYGRFLRVIDGDLILALEPKFKTRPLQDYLEDREPPR